MNKKLMLMLSIILVLISTIAYSALSTNLALTSETTIRAVEDIRVTDIEYTSVTNNASLSYESTYKKNSITSGFVLPNANSTITYTVEITNNGDVDEAIYNLTTQSNNNGLTVLINGQPISEYTPIIVPLKSSVEITVTYQTSTPSNETINAISTFDFRRVYYVTYNTNGGSVITQQVKYHDVDLTITTDRPTKNKYVFIGWTDEQDGTTVKFAPGATYTLNQDKTMYALYRQGEATFIDGASFNVKIKQLANPNIENIVSTTADTNITSIVRANALPNNFNPTDANIVSTANSDFPIYVWYNNGTLYYYTDVDNPYMNATSYSMFRSLTKVTSIDINTINTSRAQTMHAMFMDCNSLSSIDLINFNTSNVGNISPDSAMTHLFDGCSSLTTLNLSSFDTSKITSMYTMFKNCTNLQSITFGNNFNTSNVTNMSHMFDGCSSLPSLNLSSFNTGSATSMEYMFAECQNLKTLNISSFDTSNVTLMNYMFNHCHKLETINFGNNFDTSNVTNMYAMFNQCYKLTAINIGSNFKTGKVTNMQYMFNGCSSLTSLDVSSFNTSLVENMSYMFSSVSNISTLDISNFDMSSITNTTNMFLSNTVLTSLKTPKTIPSGISITLPKTLYDSNNNEYTTLDSTTSTQTWLKVPYTVTFNSNGGTGTMTDQKIGVDATTNLTANTFTREGYEFVGWNTQDNGEGTAYLDEASVTNLETFNQTVTLYAQWIGNTYTVTVNDEEGSIPSTTGWTGTGNTSTKSVTFGNTYGTLPEPTKTGYHFDGWNGKNLLNLDVPLSEPSDTDGSPTTDRTFTPNTYIKGLAINNYYSPGAITSFTASNGTITLNSYSGYGVGFPIVTESNKSYTLSYNISNVTSESYAQSAAIFYASDGSFISYTYINSSSDRHVKQTFTTPANTYYMVITFTSSTAGTKNFTNIQLEEGSEETTYEPYFVTSSTTVVQPQNHTLYARYSPSTYNAYYYDYLNDSNALQYKTITYGSTYGELPEPTKTGYTFDGWYNTSKIDTVRISPGSGTWNYFRAARVIPGNTYTVTIGNATLTEGTATGYTILLYNQTINDSCSNQTGNFNTSSTFTLTPKSTWEESDRIYVLIYSGIGGQTSGVGTEYKNITISYETEKEITSSTTVNTTSNQVLYAHWTQNTYTLTANSTGGTYTSSTGWTDDSNNNKTKSITFDNRYGTLPTVTREGYTFDGWYANLAKVATFIDNKEMTNQGTIKDEDNRPYIVTEMLPIKGGIILYSNIDVCGIYAYTENGTFISRVSHYATTHQLPNNTAYIRIELKKTSSLTYEYYMNNLVISDSETVVGMTNVNNEINSQTIVKIPSNHSLFAKWIGNAYTVTANANGGTIPSTTGWTGTGNTSTKSVTFGSEYGTLPEVSKTGYTFIGWAKENLFDINNIDDYHYESSTAHYDITVRNNKIILSGNSYASNFGKTLKQLAPTLVAGDNVVLYFETTSTSKWIYLHGSGSTYRQGNIIEITQAILDNGMYIYNDNGLTEEKTIEISNFRLMKSDTPFITSSSTVKTASNHTIEAVYSPNTYNIVFDKNDNDATGTMNNQTMSYDESENLTTNAYTKTGYTFTGWNTQADGEGTPYLDEASISNLTTTNNDTITLYAQWIATSYTVTFDYDGATTTGVSSKSVTYDSTYGTLPEPTKTGYEFLGWNGKNKFIKQGNITNASGNGLTITYDDSDQTFTINGTLTANAANPIFSRGIMDIPTGQQITFKVYHISGDASVASGSGITYAYAIFNSNNTKWTRSDNITYETFQEDYVFTKNMLEHDNNEELKVMMQLWRTGTTFNNYKIKIQIEYGSQATTYEPYYVTNNTTVTQPQNHTLKAIWKKKEATFDTGNNFNAKIKQLAGTNNATSETADSNITSIQRSNSVPQSWVGQDGTITPPSTNNVVSTNNSEYPIYAWYDNGTIYYYTEALNPHMNNDSIRMFFKLNSVVDIDISTLDTKGVSRMYAMFYECQSLTNLNLGNNFDTSAVTTFWAMFNDCRSLTTLSLNFDTSSALSTSEMFRGCTSLTSLDISSFDMTTVTSVTSMFSGVTSLKQLKTPTTIPSGLTTNLPKIMIDSSGNEYTTLTSTIPTSTWLYTPATFVEGPAFNIKIKRLANPNETISNAGTNDENITSIQRYTNIPSSSILENAVVVSTTNSYTPIYAWYSNGTIYYYSEAEHLYMNSNAQNMFRQLTKVQTIDIDTISTIQTTSMHALFYNDNELTTINLNNFDTSNITTMQSIFAYCNSLNSLDLSSFDLSNLTNTTTMLVGMTSLKQLKTPNTYPSNATITLPNLMIDGSGNEYTELTSTSPTSTWLYTPATFVEGQTFNARIKQLAGTNDATYSTVNTNITSIQRANSVPQSWINGTTITPPSDNNVVSTPDSYTPIYAWYDSGTIYYYTEATNPYMNYSSNAMFFNLHNVVSINITSVNTIKVNNMDSMFSGCNSLNNINLSNFNTSNVRYMGGMFSNCYELELANVSSFNTSNVLQMHNMFNGTRKIETLDISSFDMTKVTTITNMLSGMTSLKKLKTPNTYPSDTSLIITLPKLMIDVSGNEYSTLISTSPTSTWLGSQYTITYDLDGGTLSNSNPTTYSKISNNITLNNPTKVGYTFAGWSGGKNLFNPNDWIINNGGMYRLTGSFTSDTLRMQGNPSITDQRGFYLMGYKGGIFEYNNKKISFMNQNSINSAYLLPNGFGKVDGVSYIQAVLNANNESTADIELNIMISDEENPTTYEPYLSGQSSVTIPSGSEGNRTYTANWTPNTYSIVFDKNANDATGTMSNQSMTYGTSDNLTTNAYTLTGHTFVGWNTEADGSGTPYLDGVSVNNLTTTNNGTVTLYAQWEEDNNNEPTAYISPSNNLMANINKFNLDKIINKNTIRIIINSVITSILN